MSTEHELAAAIEKRNALACALVDAHLAGWDERVRRLTPRYIKVRDQARELVDERARSLQQRLR